jgi:hypothetical protein
VEVFLPFPAATRATVPPLTHIKGTWLTSSLLALKERGHIGRYYAALARAHHETVRNVGIGEWYPTELLLAHYDAVEALKLDGAEIVALADHVSRRAQGGVVELTARLASQSGVTPWAVMSQFDRLWARVARGAGIGVFKLGPKDARVEVVQFPGFRYRYCQVAMGGLIRSMLALFCGAVYLTEVPSFATNTQMAVKLSWS